MTKAKENTTTTIRVTRTHQVETVEFIDVTVTCDPTGYPDSETRAKELIEAMIAAGQNIIWTPVKFEPQRYPSPRLETTTLGAEKADG